MDSVYSSSLQNLKFKILNASIVGCLSYVSNSEIEKHFSHLEKDISLKYLVHSIYSKVYVNNLSLQLNIIIGLPTSQSS